MTNKKKMNAVFLAECIYNDFQHVVVPYDSNLRNYPKETYEHLALGRCRCVLGGRNLHLHRVGGRSRNLLDEVAQ